MIGVGEGDWEQAVTVDSGVSGISMLTIVSQWAVGGRKSSNVKKKRSKGWWWWW